MTPEETRILLSEVASVDNRKQSLEAAQAWHKVLGRYTLDQCRDALVIFWRNRPDDYLKPGHLADIVGRGTAEPQTCRHGIQVSNTRPCHDCEQGFTDDQPGPPAQVQAQVMADLQLGNGRWAKLADPAEVYRMKVRARAAGVVYPGERVCLDGHSLREHPPVMGANGRMCGHPSHHPEVTAETEEVDW